VALGRPAGSAVHLQEEALSRRVFHVGVERTDNIVNIFGELLVVHPTLFVHPNHTGPLPNLVVAKLAASIFDVRIEVKVIVLCCCCRCWKLEVDGISLSSGTTPKDASAFKGQLCNQLHIIRRCRSHKGHGQMSTHPRIAPVE
jgi:hypothetical protein